MLFHRVLPRGRVNGVTEARQLTDTIRSKDGTVIRYLRRGGGGPPLLLIHGTNANHSAWSQVVPALETHFTVYAMDRRGYGSSEDAQSYHFESEIEDIQALVDAVREGPANIVAHSYGAICALEAAHRSRRVHRLALYEPPIPTYAGAYYGRKSIEAIRRLVARGDWEAAVETFYAKIVRLAPSELAAMRSRPGWGEHARTAQKILRELESVDRYQLKPERFRDWITPTLLLLGGDSARPYRATAAKLNAALPGSAIAILEGQRHAAVSSAPAMFVREIVAFIKGQSPGATGTP